MKSILEEVDLSIKRWMNILRTDGVMESINYADGDWVKASDADKIRRALEASLEVIESHSIYHWCLHCSSDIRDYDRADKANAELEAALKVFKKDPSAK